MPKQPNPAGQDVDLIEIGATAILDYSSNLDDCKSVYQLRRGWAEAVIAAVKPVIEQRLRDDFFEPDADGYPYYHCEVCGKTVMYGSRHWQCGDALQRVEREAKRAVLEKIREEYGDDWIADYRRDYPDEPVMPVGEMVNAYLATLEDDQ